MEKGALDNTVWEKLLFARKVPLPMQLILSGSIGIVAAINIPPQNLLDPFLLFIIPSWCLYVLSDVYQFLCKPRTCDFAFISGISYGMRQRVARSFIKRRMLELCIISGTIISLFFTIRSLFCGIDKGKDHCIFTVMMSVELCVSLVLFACIITFSVLKPVRYDRKHFLFSLFLRMNWLYWIREWSSVFYWNMAGLGSWFFNTTIRALVRRQWLYLYRYDWFTFFVLHGVAIIGTCCIVTLLHKENILASTLILLLLPAILLLINLPPFIQSMEKLQSCPYYTASNNSLFITNAVVCGILYLPYVFIFTIQSLFFPFDVSIMRIIMGYTSFILCVTASILTFAFRFSSAGLLVINTVHFVITILCTFIATTQASQGSIAGIFIPIIPVAVLIRNRVKLVK